MKTTKVNHNEIAKAIKAELKTREAKGLQDFKNWKANGGEDYRTYHCDMENLHAIERLKAELEFHEIMMQEKKYATEWLWSDAHVYEIIEEKSEKAITVRRMKATIKPEAQKALHDSFEIEGFCGHFDNNLQEWNFESDESNPIITIRKHKDGLWYANGSRFSIMKEPYKRYDYNF